jgi:hypothetical protein
MFSISTRSALFALASLLSGVAAEAGNGKTIVTYYTDTGCNDVTTTIAPPIDNSCYDYGWTGTRSVMLTKWPGDDLVECTYYSGHWCTGSSETKGGNQCSSSLPMHRSVECHAVGGL